MRRLHNLVIILSIAAVLLVGCAGLIQKAQEGIDAATEACNWLLGTFNEDFLKALEDWLAQGGTVPEALIAVRYTKDPDDAAKVLELVMAGKAFVPTFEGEQIPWPIWMLSPGKGVPWSYPPENDEDDSTRTR